jgi:AcrR family transcriptional regulator
MMRVMKIEIPPTPEAHAKPLRSDGLEARNRLLDAALQLFADHGFSKTSTREIALAAQVNVAAISYYFGDKAGLYRAVFEDPRSNPGTDPSQFNQLGMPLREALSILMRGFSEPLKQGQLVQSCMKLHYREMLEPTGVWRDEIENNIKPAQLALVAVLCRHLGLDEADDDVHRLAFSVAGLGVMLHLAGDVYQSICPALLSSPQTIDDYADRLVTYALAMVESEARRRADAATPHCSDTSSISTQA